MSDIKVSRGRMTPILQDLKKEVKEQRKDIHYELSRALGEVKKAKACLRRGRLFDAVNAVKDAYESLHGAENLLGAEQVYDHIIRKLERSARE